MCVLQYLLDSCKEVHVQVIWLNFYTSMNLQNVHVVMFLSCDVVCLLTFTLKAIAVSSDSCLSIIIFCWLCTTVLALRSRWVWKDNYAKLHWDFRGQPLKCDFEFLASFFIVNPFPTLLVSLHANLIIIHHVLKKNQVLPTLVGVAWRPDFLQNMEQDFLKSKLVSFWVHVSF